jgi:hypothetical protein
MDEGVLNVARGSLDASPSVEVYACLSFLVQQRGPRNVPSSELVLEEDDIYFVSEIHIERYEAARRCDEIKSNHINTGSNRARPACCS